MAESFDPFRYTSYMRSRWRWIASSAAIAVALAVTVSLVETRQYTATALIVIDPPAGTDLRAAMAVSPVYLESLKTYEEVADGDSLFQEAMQKFELRRLLGSGAVESLKKRVLKVGLVRNTRVLEISGTLPDPRKAQALAQYVAEATVKLTRSMVSAGDQDLIEGIERQEREIREKLQQTETAWAQAIASEPVTQLQSDMRSAAELRASIEQQIASSQLEIADAAEREKREPAAELTEIRKEAANARARIEEMRKQLQTLDRENAEREKLLSVRQAHRDTLDVQRKAGQGALAAIETRLREARGDAGYRGERLRIVDPGIVPEKPSSPNVPLNVVAALLLGLVLPIVYLTFEMSYEEHRTVSRRTVFHAVSKSPHE